MQIRKIQSINTQWEKWPFWVVYFPLIFVWIYYMIRSRAFWFFTPSNPTITFGGLEGEPKKEMYDQLPAHLYPKTFNLKPGDYLDAVMARVTAHHLKFPFIVKPEIGGAGLLFRKIDIPAQLKEYHEEVPFEYIIQEFATQPMEISVFYYRLPWQKTGTISGFLHKLPLQVKGNGQLTLLQLLQEHPKANGRMKEIEKVHAANFNRVVPAGEKYFLSFAANHNRGAQFINLHSEIDEKLHQVFDTISNQVDGWYYGRYDVMCQSVESLKQGKDFVILEYNGCGAEPNHIYDAGYTIGAAYAEILKHWKVLFRISKYNSGHGTPPWPFLKGLAFMRRTKKHYRAMRKLDKELSF